MHLPRSISVIVAKFHTMPSYHLTDFQFLQIVVTDFSYRHNLLTTHDARYLRHAWRHFVDKQNVVNRVLIEVLRVEKGYGAKRIITEILGRNFSLASVKLGWLRGLGHFAKASLYRCRIRYVDHLKERLIAEWRRFDQNIIDRAVNQWRERLCDSVGVSERTEDTFSIKFKRSDYLTWQQLCLLIEFLTGFI